MTETTEVTLDDSERSKDLSDRAGEAPEGMDEQAFGDSVDDLEALPGSARRALAALLTNRFITRTGNRAAWEALLDHEPRIRSRLADLFLDLVVDRDYDVAFKRQSDKEDVPVMLRRDRPLTREATLLLVHMRQLHAYTDSQDDPDLLPLDAIADFLAQFRAPQDTDDARFDKRVESAINALNSIGWPRLIVRGSSSSTANELHESGRPRVTDFEALEILRARARGACCRSNEWQRCSGTPGQPPAALLAVVVPDDHTLFVPRMCHTALVVGQFLTG